MNKAQEEALRVIRAREQERERAIEVENDATKTVNRRTKEWDEARRKARELGVVVSGDGSVVIHLVT